MDVLSKNEANANDTKVVRRKEEKVHLRGRSPPRYDSRCHDRLGIASHIGDCESTKGIPYSFPPFKEGPNLLQGRTCPSFHLKRGTKRLSLAVRTFFGFYSCSNQELSFGRSLDWLFRSSCLCSFL